MLAVVGALLTGPSPAAASVTIGQVGVPAGCELSDNIQPTVTSGSSYVVPAVGTITSWSHRAGTAVFSNPQAKMKVFRPLGGSAYQVVGSDGPRPLSPNILHTFATSIPVMPGDVLGLWVPDRAADDSVGCSFSAPGDSFLRRSGDLADGQSGAFATSTSTLNRRVNVSAVLEPSNSFTLGDLDRNRKKGTATLDVIVPNPGQLDLSGKGVKRAADGGTRVTTAATVPTAGTVELLIKAKGRKKRKLREKGKVKMQVNVAYTPTGGAAATQSRKLKLRKKR